MQAAITIRFHRSSEHQPTLTHLRSDTGRAALGSRSGRETALPIPGAVPREAVPTGQNQRRHRDTDQSSRDRMLDPAMTPAEAYRDDAEEARRRWPGRFSSRRDEEIQFEARTPSVLATL